MRRLLYCFAVVLILISTAQAASAEMVEPYLDATCTTLNGGLTVPNGMVAVNFSATMSSPWRACSVDSPIHSIGFIIVDSDKNWRYTYTQLNDGSTQETEGSLSSLSLGPGSYYVHVQGGLDTKVRLTYNLMTKKLFE